MKPYRSSLFVPGNRSAWMEKAAGYGADCLILDLEDSVPNQEKIPARPLVKKAIKFLQAKGQTLTVRVNGFATGTETLFLRSKSVLDCRAANVPYPMISSWWNKVFTPTADELAYCQGCWKRWRRRSARASPP